MESFDNLQLNDALLKGVYLYGFTKPSTIQLKGIEIINSKKDCIIQSQSGTGKTAMYLLGVLNNILINNKLIIFIPTRELAIQVYDVALQLSKYINCNIVKCIGGININDTRNSISNASLIIGTVGRIFHMISEKRININKISTIVFDEADELLLYRHTNTHTNINELIQSITKKPQLILISATMTLDVFNFSKQYMHSPEQILINNENVVVDLISQFYLDVEIEEQKYDTLLDLYNMISTFQTIIFCNTINKVNWLNDQLTTNNFTTIILHANMDQLERNTILENFRNGITRILITTDLLSRGIDIPHVNLVINYDIPINKEIYVHRIGRCGRFDKKGIAITLIKSKDCYDMKCLNKLKQYYKINITEMPPDISIYV